jgi:hypothetical protein
MFVNKLALQTDLQQSFDQNPKEFTKFSVQYQTDLLPREKAPISINLTPNQLDEGDYVAILNPVLRHKFHVYGPDFTFHSSEFRSHVLLTNLTRSTTKLYKDMTIYFVYKLTDFQAVEVFPLTKIDVNKTDCDTTYDPLHEININPDLTENQKEALRALVSKYRHIFLGPNDNSRPQMPFIT